MIIRKVVAFSAFCGLLSAAGSRELTGRVVDSDTGAPIARAHVTLRFFQGSAQGNDLRVMSDVEGTFQVSNLPESGYQITCEKAGYLPGNQGVSPSNAPDGKGATVVLRLTAQAVLEATVVDDKDVPAESVFLQLLRQQVVNGRRQYLVSGGGGTDEAGHVRLFGLPAGHYYVGIGVQRLNGPQAKTTAYPPLFYPNSTEIEAAQPVDLKAGDEAQIHIRLPQPVPAHEIRGVVATASENVGIQLIRQPPDRVPLANSVQTNWDAKTHSFHINHVVPGIYQLIASVQKGVERQQASTMVTVGDADVSGLRLEPLDDPGITGAVRLDGTGEPIKNGYVSVQSLRSGNGAQVDADGKFHILNVQPDRYRVSAPNTNGAQCVGSIQQGGRDVRDGVTVSAEVLAAPIDIVITNHCGSIEGTLSLPDSTAAATVLTVMLLRKSGDEFILEKQTFLAANAGKSTATFRFQGVTPGDYVLFAWQQGAEVEYANPEYMKQFESYGTAVTVTDGGKASVSLDKVLILPGR